MGNSPSKNDPLPNTNNVTSAGLAAGLATSDVEAEEPNLSALSRPTGNGSPSPLPSHTYSQLESPSNSKKLKNPTATSEGRSFSSEASRANNLARSSKGSETNDVSSPTVPGSVEYSEPVDIVATAGVHVSVDKASLISSVLSPRDIPSHGSSTSNHLSTELVKELDLSLALLVVTDRSPSIPNESDLASSVDTQRSGDLSVSPVFTLCDKDESLVSSLYSFNNLPTHMKIGGSHQPVTSSLESNLAPIVEVTSETTPEPSIAKSRTSESSVASVVAEIRTKPILKRTGRKQSLSTSKLVNQSSNSESGSSSPVLISPPAYSNVKLDFDIDDVISRLVKAGKRGISNKFKDRKAKDKLPVSSSEIKSILARARLIFMDQPTLLQLSPPVKIVGDIHGQYHDLIRIFNSCGYPPQTNYLFLGDYVDRGYKSLELILLLLSYKIKYPENFFMLRGNHELANITKIYGFYDECKRRLPAISGSHKLWKSFIDVFNTLPIAATINDKIFCIHGGLSPELTSLKQIQQIQRPTDIPDRGLLADLLWSDPDPLVRTYSPHNWPKNDRGVSYCFGKKHVDQFLSTFNMDLIVRGHMVVEDGYQFFNKRKLVTVFLAPNYCGEFNNYGAVMSVDRSLCCSFELIKP